MFANYLIGLREGLEAGLVVSILVAYLVKTERRSLLPRIWVGVGAAVVVALAFGFALFFGPRDLGDDTREGIEGAMSVVAVALVTWMIFWMARTARQLARELRGQIDQAAEGNWFALVLVAMLAVGREGLETALFLWSTTDAATRGTDPTATPLLGAALGIATAVLLAYLLYRGAITINLSRFFAWTGGFLIVVAAGVLSAGLHDLQEAGILPGLTTLAWDVSGTIDPSSWYATLLRGVFSFSPVTTVLSATAWVAYFVPTMTLFVRGVRHRATAQTTEQTADRRHAPAGR